MELGGHMPTKKSKKIAPKQAEPSKAEKPTESKAEEPTTSKAVAAVKSVDSGIELIRDEIKDLLSGVKALEKEVKEVSSSQDRMTAQYATFTKSVDDRVLNITNNKAFGEGMRFLITMAETNLAKELKLPDRNALANDGRNLPAWWLATLMQCYEYLPAKPIQPTKDEATVLVDKGARVFKRAGPAAVNMGFNDGDDESPF